MLARMLYDGDGVVQDKLESAKWYHLAAGNEEPEVPEGSSFTPNLSASVADPSASQTYEQQSSTQRKTTDSTFERADASENESVNGAQDSSSGESQVEVSEPGADVKNLREAAIEGDAEAQRELASRYEQGHGVPKNLREADKWFQRAAEQGDAAAQEALKGLQSEGQITSNQQDQQQEPEVDSGGSDADLDKQNGMGNSTESHTGPAGGEDSENSQPDRADGALAKLLSAANDGDVEAQKELAEKYRIGDGVSCDSKEAAKWYRTAAEQGDATAQTELAMMLRTGESGTPDATEAAQWLLEATKSRDARAERELGLMYSREEGVEKNLDEAAAWLRRAASQGDIIAQKALASFYFSGEGVEKSPQSGVRWLRRAAD